MDRRHPERAVAALIALVLAAGCVRNGELEPNKPPPTRHAAKEPAPAEPAEPAEPAADTAELDGPDANDPKVATIVIINGDAAPEDYIDLERGLIVVDYRGKNDRGVRRVCGDNLVREYYDLSLLGERHQGSSEDRLCDDWVCTVRGAGAGLPDHEFHFARTGWATPDRGGWTRLHAVVRISRTSLGSAAAEAGQRWAKEQIEKLGEGSCAQR
jgi:hypothetical protein